MAVAPVRQGRAHLGALIRGETASGAERAARRHMQRTGHVAGEHDTLALFGGNRIGNLEEAIELLKSAGYEFTDDNMLSDATPITFEYLTNEGTGHVAIAESLQQDFAVIGINMTIKTVDWNVFLEERKAGNYDIARNGWLADFNDPINMLEMWTTDSGNNDAQYGR